MGKGSKGTTTQQPPLLPCQACLFVCLCVVVCLTGVEEEGAREREPVQPQRPRKRPVPQGQAVLDD